MVKEKIIKESKQTLYNLKKKLDYKGSLEREKGSWRKSKL